MKDRNKKVVWNVRFVIGASLVAIVLAVGAYFWHGRQVGQMSGALLEQATRHEEAERWGDAADYLSRFLRIAPDDPQSDEAAVRLARVYDKASGSSRPNSRTVELYYRALGVATEEQQTELRHRTLQLLLDLDRFAEAEVQALAILQATPDDAVARRALALALVGQVEGDQLLGKHPPGLSVGDQLRLAIELNPTDDELATLLARTYRLYPNLLSANQRDTAVTTEQRNARADSIMDDLVSAAPKSGRVRLARHVYRRQFGLSGAEADLQAAQQSGGDDATILLAAAANAAGKKTEEGDAEAERLLRKIIETVDPDSLSAYLALGDLYARNQRTEDAIKVWSDGVTELGVGTVDLHARLARAQITEGDLNAANENLAAIDQKLESREVLLNPMYRKVVRRAYEVLRARWLLANGGQKRDQADAVAAAAMLRRLALDSDATAADRSGDVEVAVLLGNALGQLGQWDAAAAAYDRAVEVQPKMNEVRLAAARAWQTAGRPDAAATRLMDAARLDPKGETWLNLALALFREQIMLPVRDRDWASFEGALAEAGRAAEAGELERDWRVDFLQADYAVRTAEQMDEPQAGRQAALDQLGSVEKEYPDNLEVQERLVFAYNSLGDDEAADKALAQYQQLAGPTANAVGLHARLLELRGETTEAMAVLEEGLKQLSGPQANGLATQLIRLNLAAGNTEQARQSIANQITQRPGDIALLHQAGLIALEVDDFVDAERTEGKLREVEGEGGHLWRHLRALRLLQQNEETDSAAFREAVSLQQAIQKARPTWAAGYTLAGQLADRRGDTKQTIEALKRAIDLGERRPVVFQRLLFLVQDDVQQVERYMAMLRDPGRISSNLAEVQIALAAGGGRTAEALSLARREAERRPEDHAAQLWLGRMLLASTDEAEPDSGVVQQSRQAFEKAVELAPDRGDAWSALVLFERRLGDSDKAMELVKRFEAEATLEPPAKADLAAQFYALLGDREIAAERYAEAIRLDPDNTSVRLRAADFQMRDDPEKAEQNFRQVLAADPSSTVARRGLAALLVDQGGKENWQESVRLLEGDNSGGQSAAGDRRLKAYALVFRQGKDNLRQAQKILEDLVDKSQAIAGDRLLLAELYELEGKSLEARNLYIDLVTIDSPSPAHVTRFIRFLIRQESWADVGIWLDKLERQTGVTVQTLGMRGMLLQGLGRETQIEPLVEEFATKEEDALQTDQEDELVRLLQNIGTLYASLGLDEAAERWQRRLVELQPAAFSSLALTLTRQDRKADAIKLCVEAAKTDTTIRPAVTACVVLSAGESTSDEADLAQPLLDDAMRQNPENVQLLLPLANLRHMQNRNKEARAIYEKILQLQPKNAFALNNLASMLGEDVTRAEEALKYADLAIDILGEQPALLDTKATILMNREEFDQAVRVLEPATNILEPDPRILFHLALAYQRTGKLDQAAAALQRAELGNLDQQMLAQADRETLAELRDRIKDYEAANDAEDGSEN